MAELKWHVSMGAQAIYAMESVALCVWVVSPTQIVTPSSTQWRSWRIFPTLPSPPFFATTDVSNLLSLGFPFSFIV